jgi:VCBS repeat-containing protein
VSRPKLHSIDRIGIFSAAFSWGAPMRLSGSVGKSASDLFAEFFPTGTVSLDVSQNSPSDASSAPTASSNPEPTGTTAQSVPPQPPGLLAHNGSDGSPSDLDSASAGTVADASSEHAPASATTDSDNAFYALSSDAYWSNDGGVSPRPAELGADGHDGGLPSITNGSDATSAAGFAWSHFTFNDTTSAVSSNAPIHAGPSSGGAASGAPIETITAAPPALHPSEAPPPLMVVGDLGSFAASSAGSGGTGSGSGSGGALVSGGSGSSGLVINIVWDASVANAPAGFKAGVEAVVSYFESHFSNPITITIDVGYGEVDGQPLGVGALAESATVLTSVSYSALEAALVNNANAIGDTAAAANTPTTSPVSGNWWLSTAEALALGLSNVGGGPDGYIGFSSSVSFCYNDSNGVPLGQYDFFGVVAHEISEVMGRQMMDGENFAGGTSYEPLDLFHYSAAGVHDFSGTTAGYFSPDGGTTNLGNFNTNPSGDFGDWAGSVGNNSFLAFSNSGVVNPVTANDLAEMSLLGWDPTTSGAAPVVTIALADDTSGGNDITANDALTGTADPNATVTLTKGSAVLGTTTANAGGVWSFTPIGLAQGLQTITASETNAAGLTGSSSLTFTYETTAPIVTIALADDTSGGNDITTNDALTGSADPNATVTLTESSTALGTTTADANGVWSFTPTNLAQGLQTITASETNAAGLTGSSSLTFTYETTPKVTIKLVDDTSGGKNITSFDALTGTADPNATVTLTEGSTVLGTTTANANGVWSFTRTNLAQGLQTITASETNAAGLTGSSSLTFTYQRTAPKVTIALADDTSGGKNITSDDALTGTADPNATVKISEGSTVLGTTTANASGVWSFTPTSLAQGLQTITASETNPAGLTGYSFLTFTYKATASNVTNDAIDLPHSEFADFAALQAELHAVGNSVVPALDAIDSITLTHLQIQSLHAQNFHFF